MSDFVVKDSGERKQFASGMVRDTAAGKVEYHRVLEGPMLERWAEHLTKGAAKYPDNPDGSANWTLAAGQAEYNRFKASAFRHMMQLLRGDTDEDHAAAVFFNINGMMYVQEKMNADPPIDTSEYNQWLDEYNERTLRLFDEETGNLWDVELGPEPQNSFDRMPDK